MSDTIDPNEIIISRASISSDIALPWRFIAAGHLYVDDRDLEVFVGDIYYANALFEIRSALKVRDWCFCLERMTAAHPAYGRTEGDPKRWMIAAFRGQKHYSFEFIEDAPAIECNRAFLAFVTGGFLPLLHLDTFGDRLKTAAATHTGVSFGWKIEELKEGDSVVTIGTPGWFPRVARPNTEDIVD